MYIRDVLGTVSAGTLGYIAGNVRGAKTAIRAYNSLPNSMKRTASMSGSSKRVKTSAGTFKVTPVSRTTRVNNKKPARRRRSGRYANTKGCKPLTKCLKKQVRNIALRAVHNEQPKGKYVKTVLYEMNQVHGSATTPLQNVINTYLFQGSTLTPDSFASVGEYRKIIDAISVLWNSKAAGFYTATGNASPSQMIVADVNHTAYYQWTNNTLLDQIFIIYETTPKEDTSNTVYTNWNAMSVEQAGGTTRGITYFGMRPEMYPQFRDQYRILKKTTITIKPGQRYSYVLKTADKHLRFDRWMQPGTTTPWNFRKGFTKELLIINYAQPVVGKSTATYIGAEWNVGNNSNSYGIVLQMKDIITCRCPENIANTNAKDNTICVFSRYADEVDTATASTIIPKAISVVAPQQ